MDIHCSQRCILWLITLCIVRKVSGGTNLTKAQEFLDNHNQERQKVLSFTLFQEWNYYTNITEENRLVMVQAQLAKAQFIKEAGRNASMFDWKTFPEAMRRQFAKIVDIDTAALQDQEKLKRYNDLKSEMATIYRTAKVCLTDTGCVNPNEERSKPIADLVYIMATSYKYDRLTRAWKGWRDETGKKMKNLYAEFVSLGNEAHRESGFADTGDYWRSWYETPTFAADMARLFQQLKPMYVQLHAYTRKRLMKLYGKDKFPKEGHIPAQLLGNMWAQTWSNLNGLLRPYKNKTRIDTTAELRKQNYTAKSLFEIADEFFTSIGLIPLPHEFWNHSMLVRPTDGRNVFCTPSAWDFMNGKDFRIQACTAVSMGNLVTTHHEMGHIQYYLQYKDQPVVFRDGANPGFHEAIGDTIALSVSTPKHLEKIGLLAEAEDDIESDLNFLLKMSLEKIAFLPFGYLMDQWRWSVFSGETLQNMYNTKWWQLRCDEQGISPPVERSENDFDPGSKYHIVENVPFIRYFVSFVIQFQFHKALCNAAGHAGPLYKCDIYNSKEAGKLLSDVLKLGASRPWPEVMKIITGQEKMDAGPLIKYFKPLTDWLKEQNKGELVGWGPGCPNLKQPTSAANSDFCNVIVLWILTLVIADRILMTD